MSNISRRRTIRSLGGEDITKVLRTGDGALSQDQKKDILRELGNDTEPAMKSGKRFISDFHDHLIAIFNTKDPKRKSDESIVDTLVKEAAEQAKTDQFLKFQGDLKGKERDQCNSPLQFLLAKGGENQKILHRVFDPESPICRSDDEGDDRDGEVDVPRIEADGPTSLTKANTPKTKVDDPASKQPFGHLTAFVEFLVRLQPELLVALDKEKRTPLFSAIILEGIDISAKERMLRYFCENTGPKPFDETIVEKARKSLTIMGKYRFDDDDDDDDEYNALHLAIMKDVYIGERTVDGLKKMFASVKNKRGRREQTPCLQIPGANGDTPLHMALSVGGNHTWSDAKISWAKTLAKLEPRLLGVGRTVPDGAGATQKLTPLQLFTEQLSKRSLNKKGRDQSTKALGADLEQELESLRDYLKLQCLKVYTDDSEAKDIMYPDNDRYEPTLSFPDEVISRKSLEELSKHYRHDTTLRYLYIPKVDIDWPSSDPAFEEMAKLKCKGKTDLYMIFNWLTASNTTKVRKIIEVVVDDFEDAARPSHCDDAIVKCLKPFNIEAWDWRRMDIDSDVISRAAGDHVRVVNLYCSGLNAVLRSWSDREGLPSLKALEEVYLETHQGRESLETMERYVSKFEERLKENYKLCHGRELLVECAPVTAAPDDAAGGKKGGINTGVKNGRGREEEDWLLCMDEFSKFIQTCPPKAGSSSRTVTVALIDDGVQSSYDGLNVNIQNGESWAKAREFQWGKPGRRFRPTYYTSQHGHGTVMAWYIRRVCREVRLLVAKLDSVMAPRTPVTFSIESAAKAIDWAVKEGADIINMSWAIDMHEADRSSDKRYKPLKDAIEKAVKKNILLFCANPDKGSEEAEPKTFPKCLPGVTSLFCIGAAENGQRWMKISRNDETCDFFLPGVRLDIEAESRQGNPKGSKSFEQWKEFGGSSLACALASGLAAMILHCSQICDITNEQWAWLKSYNGMKAAFESLQVTSELWLPVRKVFGQPFVSKTDTPEKKRQRLREDVVDKHFLATMPKPEGKRR